MFGFIIFIVIAVLVIGVVLGVAQIKDTKVAHKAYLEALTQLKDDPANADKKQRTLALGRAYSNLTRDNKGQTLFDEMALMNDINAACAAAANLSSEQRKMPTGKTVEDRLLTLSELQKKGLISQPEYESRRSEILHNI